MCVGLSLILEHWGGCVWSVSLNITLEHGGGGVWCVGLSLILAGMRQRYKRTNIYLTLTVNIIKIKIKYY